ncbi:valine--pyruvate transaminase ['Osedax' symbiont bacterium Rs2_46_30_T18]|nr:valine--pyruvate transaminase ['Osedax' symbiont bacterium Rs2_46_30_T18]
MKLSAFGEKFSARSGAVELMDDLGNALLENPNAILMGGGNPGQIPAMEQIFQQRLQSLIDDPTQRHNLLGRYQSPQGEKNFRQQMASFLKRKFNWQLSEKNIGISNGSQSAFFVLYNMFAGKMSDGSQRSIHLPLSPEYLGYADIGLADNFFTATKPNIELLDEQQFKYRVNFSQLQLDSSAAALCVSRPTNPTGNVLTDNEISHLDDIAHQHDIPLIIDGAYGLPFPNIIFNDAQPHWNENTILVLSLSKLGLPGARTGIIVASEELIQAYSNSNTVISLACGTLGPAICQPMFADNSISELSDKHITPFYRQRSQQTLKWLQQDLAGLPFRVHKPEGAIFLWLWFKDMPIDSNTLYQRLKQRGVIIVPGHNFFVGIEEQWQHQHECIRVSYAADEKDVRRGVQIIAEEVRKAYSA